MTTTTPEAALFAPPLLADYIAGVLAQVRPLRPLRMGLLPALGAVLVNEVRAHAALPPFDTVEVDGYAVRSADLAGASTAAPRQLAVIGDVRASSWAPSRVSPGACYAVVAGAPVPAGADAILPLVWTDEGLATVVAQKAPLTGSGIRRAGEEVRAGTVVAQAGAQVTPGLIALLASVGVDTVAVRPRPRVAVIATGDELVDPGRVSGPGRVIDANSYALAAAAQETGAQVTRVGIGTDEPGALRALLDDQVRHADLVLVSGGTGHGPNDTVRRLLSRVGSVDFSELPLYPAGVLGFGGWGPEGIPVVCVPGDPTSALTGFEVLARPVIQRLAGAEGVFRRSVKVTLTDPVVSPRDVREFRPAVITARRGGGYSGRPLPGGSRSLSGYAGANGLLVLGERVAHATAGSIVDAIVFDASLGL
jgi:molybdopterin molybdotransferase